MGYPGYPYAQPISGLPWYPPDRTGRDRSVAPQFHGFPGARATKNLDMETYGNPGNSWKTLESHPEKTEKSGYPPQLPPFLGCVGQGLSVAFQSDGMRTEDGRQDLT